MNFKKIALSFLALLTISLSLHAQGTPQYYFSVWDGSSSTGWFNIDNMGSRCQSIFYPTDFPDMPSGAVKNIYFRLYPIATSVDTATYHNLEIKLGTTTRDTFRWINNDWDTFVTNMHPVYFASSQFFNGILTKGRGYWLKFPAADYIYEHNKNLVVEISQGWEPFNRNNRFRLMASKTTKNPRTLTGYKDSLRAYNAGTKVLLDVGFDINPTGVAGVSNIQALGLFPNPSTDGYFVLSLESGKAIKTLSVAIMDVTGRKVLRKEYVAVGTEFGQEIDARQLPKGSYIVLINADGEKITRKLLLQ